MYETCPRRYLEWAITEGSEVRRQDAAAVLTGVTRSTVGYYVARDFIYDRIEDVYNAYVYTSMYIISDWKLSLGKFPYKFIQFGSYLTKHPMVQFINMFRKLPFLWMCVFCVNEIIIA